MKPEEIYEAWLEKRRCVEASAHLTDKIMAAIEEDEGTRAAPGMRAAPIVGWLAARPWARAAALAAGGLVGVARILFILIVVLER